MPFNPSYAIVKTHDGRNFTLQEPLVYVSKAGETIIVPPSAESDGGSIPRLLWRELPPFGDYWLATYLHDYLYRKTQRSKEECDNLLLEAMESLGVNIIVRNLIYDGVVVGGGPAFEEDRQ